MNSFTNDKAKKYKLWLNVAMFIIIASLICGAFMIGKRIIDISTHYSDTKTIVIMSEKDYNSIQKSKNYNIVNYSDEAGSVEQKNSLNDVIQAVDRDLETTLADMQAITLAIAAIAVAFLTIIIAILNFFRERKLELERYQVEELQQSHSELQETASLLTSIQIVQSMQVDYDESYYDAINEYLTRNYPNNQTVLVRVSLWHRLAAIAEKNNRHGKQLECYKTIIKEAKNALKEEGWSKIERETLILATLNAYYKYASELKRQNTKEAKKILEDAQAFVEKEKDTNSKDTLGYIKHYEGLLKLWSVLGEEPPENSRNILNEAIDLLDESLSLSPTNGRFHNDIAVAYMKQFEMDGSEEAYHNAQDALNKSLLYDPQHGLTYLNRATLVQKDLLKRTFNIKEEVFTVSEMKAALSQTLNKEDVENKLILIDGACDDLEKAHHYRPKFTNNFYKKAELLLYKYLIMNHAEENGWPVNSMDEKKLKEEIVKCFECSERINREVLGCLYIKRNYYDAFGETEEALRINQIIRKKSHHNADEWNNKYSS